MRVSIAAMFLLIAASTIGPTQADPYRYCLVGGTARSGSNCYFMTLEQCRASASGGGGFCQPNGFYDGRPVGSSGDAAPATTKRKKKT